MDNENTKNPEVLTSPRPVFPREAAIVDGRAVTFRWEPVEEASAYRLEVANDAAFESVAFEEEVPADTTTLTVTDVFPTDDQTFFWRILAKNEEGWSRGERIESFVSGTREEVAQHIEVPDETEEVGPVGGLMQRATETVSEELAGEKTEPVEERLQEERELGVAYEGVPSSQILAISVSILLAVAIIVILLFQWTNLTAMSIRETTIDPDDYVLLRQTQQEDARKLEQYEAVDEEAGTYRIPIDEAMERILNEEYQQEDRTYSPEAPFTQDAQ